jgi:heme-degrading monooxygenase HmoA
MIVRIWRSELDSSRSSDYERFEANESLHVFVRQPGFIAVLFARAGANNVVTMSFWDDQESANLLLSSPIYQELMKKLEVSGMLIGAQSYEVLEVNGGYLPAAVEFKSRVG